MVYFGLTRYALPEYRFFHFAVHGVNASALATRYFPTCTFVIHEKADPTILSSAIATSVLSLHEINSAKSIWKG